MKRQPISETSFRQHGSAAKLDGLVVGRLAAIDDEGKPLVDFEGNVSEEPVAARAACELDAGDLGAELALMFEAGDASRPVVLGTVRSGLQALDGLTHRADLEGRPIEVRVDGERVEIRAKHEITIRAGRASITLCADGKVVIRGTDLLSRASGTNRIRGGSVQLN